MQWRHRRADFPFSVQQLRVSMNFFREHGALLCGATVIAHSCFMLPGYMHVRSSRRNWRKIQFGLLLDWILESKSLCVTA